MENIKIGPMVISFSILILITGWSPLFAVKVDGVSTSEIEPLSTGAASETPKWNDTDDLIFIHHSCGRNWLNSGLDSALLAKEYIDERNDVYYDTRMSNDSGRPNSLGRKPGDYTDMRHWLYWFNDYFENLKTFRCADGANRIIMFKSCFPTNNIASNGTEPGNPFNSSKTIANYKAVYRHYNSSTSTYSKGGYTYKTLENIFAENPDILFIPVTSPPRHYGPSDATTDAEGHRARDFANWLENDWLDDYNSRNPGLDNVAVYDWFDLLAYPDNHSSHPNRLRYEYGGNSGDSHPNSAANSASTTDFASGSDNFIDIAWKRFNKTYLPHQWPMFGGGRNRNGSTSSVSISLTSYSSWNQSTGGDVTTSVSVDEFGNLYFGSNDSKIYSVLNNGSLNWSYVTSGNILSTPALTPKGEIVAGSDDGRLYAIRRNGSLRWSFPANGKIRSSPLIDKDGNILFSTDRGNIYSLYSNGSAIWNLSLGSGNMSSPAIDDDSGAVYIGSSEGRLHCIYPNGTEKWNISLKSSILSTPSVHNNGSILFGSDGGKFYSIHENGTQLWNTSTGSRIRTSAALKGDEMIIFGADDGYVYSLTQNGSLEWTYDTGGTIRSSPIIDGNSSVFIGSDNGTLLSLSGNGTLRWVFESGGPIRGSPSMDERGYIYVGSNDDRMYSIGKIPPDPPTELTSSSGSGWINISWNAPSYDGGSDILHYSVFRRIGIGSSSRIGNTSGTETHYNDSSISNEKEYHYLVKAVNEFGASLPSGEIEVDLSVPVFGDDHSDTNATTGDPFSFNISSSDDPDSVTVYLEYRFGSGSTTNVTMVGSGPFIRNIIIPSGSLDTLHYRFHSTDGDDNWNTTPEKNVPVVDNDIPSFGIDSTPAADTSGDPITFSIVAADNIEISTVNVQYRFGSGAYTNSTMTDSSGTYTLTISIPENETDDLYYEFHAEDSSGNWAGTVERRVIITDVDRPEFGLDSTPGVGTTGEDVTLSVVVTDNVGVSLVNAEYWRGNGSHTNSSMTGSSGTYSLTVSIPSNSSDDLHYIFHASDDAGNWATSDQKDVTISDDDRPIFGTDSTPVSGTTGDQVTLSIEVTDNIGVTSVYAEYWSGNRSHMNYSMTGASGTYRLTVTLPSDTTDDMYYIFHATDDAGNWVSTSQEDVTVTDDDRPLFGKDSTPISGTTGDRVVLTIAVTDNIEVYSVHAEYWFGTGSHTNSSMTGSSGTFILTVSIPSDSTDDLHYIFHASDDAGNRATSDQEDVRISDDDRPLFGTDSTPLTGTTGDQVTLSVEVTDNIDVSTVHAEYWFGMGSHTNSSMTRSSGTYSVTVQVPSTSMDGLHYIFHASDDAGNWATSTQEDVTINDDDRPVFQTDNTPGSGTTGDLLTFSVSVSDNIQTSSVFTRYRFGDGQFTNSTMSGSLGIYSLTVTVPSDSTDRLYYTCHASDDSGNWATTPEKSVRIMDDDSPVFGVDHTPRKATTGDLFNISIDATDNIRVSSVHVEYRFGNGLSMNSSATRSSNTFSLIISVPVDSTDDLHYIIRAVDRAGNWVETPIKDVDIEDNDRPVMGVDHSPSSGTTGDTVILGINVTDNIGVSSVHAEYWFGNGSRYNVSMEVSAGMFLLSVDVPWNMVNDLNYMFHAIDDAGNHEVSVRERITITDDDIPEFVGDSSPLMAHTGDIFIFSVEVTDNIGVREVWVEYWFGNGDLFNLTMGEDSNWDLGITIPSDQTSDLNYVFHAIDRSNNHAALPKKTIPVVDNDIPVLISDFSKNSATTGDIFEFGISVEDNIGINRTTVEYWFGDLGHRNESLEYGGNFGLDITIPENMTAELSYIFHFSDLYGNWNQSRVRSIPVTDNDPPVLIDDMTSALSYTGRIHSISAVIKDNIGIDHVFFERWDSDGNYLKSEMTLTGGKYRYSIEIPTDSLDPIRYRLVAIDHQNNRMETNTLPISVLDIIPPVLQQVGEYVIYMGQSVSIPINATDNIGLAGYYLGDSIHDFVPGNIEYVPDSHGFHNLTLGVFDGQGNEVSVNISVEVLPENHDRDGDSLPDLVEIEMGFDPDDPSDVLEDHDGDGISTLDEIGNGTDHMREDSDSDGMPDGWEMEYGLDPLTFDANLDPDKDRRTNLEEYRDGTDPASSNMESEDDSSSGILIIIVLVAAVIASIVAGGWFYNKNRNRENE